MKTRLLAAFVACAIGHDAALADLTARYRLSRSEKMVVQVNDRGDSRISASRRAAVVTRAGVAFFVITDRLGTYAVREADVRAEAAMGLQPLGPWLAIGCAPPDCPGNYHPVEEGNERVAGRIGLRWRIEPGSRRRRRDSLWDGNDSVYVVSSDPALAPIGAALNARFERSADSYLLRLGGVGISGTLPSDLHAIIRRGTMLRIGNLVRLRRVHTRPLPASAFALPTTILTREEFIKRSAAAAWPLN